MSKRKVDKFYIYDFNLYHVLTTTSYRRMGDKRPIGFHTSRLDVIMAKGLDVTAKVEKVLKENNFILANQLIFRRTDGFVVPYVTPSSVCLVCGSQGFTDPDVDEHHNVAGYLCQHDAEKGDYE